VRIVGRLVLNRTGDNFFAETEQVAFCTQNIVPGVDFSNDPLLQGRNFSYLDTQIKRLGSPNFTHIPINAPKCPFAHFQQDGHMAMVNPKGRVNYEPNSWSQPDAGPRETPEGFRSFAEPIAAEKTRARSETFADHYSQARQFYISQQPNEQAHIAKALTFELSKVERPEIRARVVAHLLNIDDGLAEKVATGLGLDEMPDAAAAAMTPRDDLEPSSPLSIIQRGPKSFKGRKLGALVTDGVDAGLLKALRAALKKEGAVLKIIAPKIGGVTDSDGNLVPADEKIDGGPSVLFDAVVVLASEDGAAELTTIPPARDFVADAFAHCKFIAYSPEAMALFEKAGVANAMDDGFVELNKAKDVGAFVEKCRDLRLWTREDTFAPI
jgi:catalase